MTKEWQTASPHLETSRSNHHGDSSKVAIRHSQSQGERTHHTWPKALTGCNKECRQEENTGQAQIQYPVPVLHRKARLHRQSFANHICYVEGCYEQHRIPAAQLL